MWVWVILISLSNATALQLVADHEFANRKRSNCLSQFHYSWLLAMAAVLCVSCHVNKLQPHASGEAQRLGGLQPRTENLHDTDERGTYRIDADASESTEFKLHLHPGATPQLVCYRVIGPVKGFKLNDEKSPLVGDLSGLINHVTAHCESDREKAEALFRFVVDDVKDWYYPAQGIDLTVEDLGVLIWNFGYGFCYDMGRLQAGLWHHAGLRSRIVGWPQHTLAEVYYDGGWHLYDLQHRSFYEKPDGSVAGFHELQADPTLFETQLNEFGLDPIGYPPHHLAHWYQIAKPNFQDSDEGIYWKTERSFAMDLRVGEFFEIFYTEPAVTYHPDSWSQYYGEMTLRKDPPWPIQGRLTYAPGYQNQKAQWSPVQTPEGTPGYQIDMASPFIFTEAWVRAPEVAGFTRVWVKVWGHTQFVGRLVGGNALLNRFIQGSNRFTVIIEANDAHAFPANLERSEIHSRLQISPIGVPKLRPGTNSLPLVFESGSPHLSAWYLEHAADLVVTSMKTIPKHPKPGDRCDLVFTVRNRGSGRSVPTELTVNNNTTVLMSETVRRVGVATIPPLNPGSKIKVKLPWVASTEMSWYGQNPHVQLIDAWLDLEKRTADANRDNNRFQQYVVLRQPDGAKVVLPGYVDLP